MFKKLAVALAVLAAGVGAASAADMRMPIKAPPPVVAVYNWTGFYIGGNAGYSWGRSATDADLLFGTSTLIASASDTFKMDGWVAGGQIGYNWQQGPWVFGFEADGQATGEKGSIAFLCGPACTFIPTTSSATLDQKLDWFATFRGRIGYAFVPTAMWYVTGGLAVGEIKSDVTYVAPGTGIGFGAHKSTRVGWTVGTGAEFQLVGNWTGKVEYLYMDLGHFSFGDFYPFPAGGGSTVNFNSHFTDHILRGGINYRF